MYKLLFSLLLAVILISCSGDKKENQKDMQTNKSETKLDKMMDLESNETLVAIIQTNMGNIELELYPNEVPMTVKNFVGLAEQGYYDGVTFHRVINDFMIQGGDPTGTGSGGKSIYGGPFKDEFNANLSFDQAGLLAMANAGPNTNQSQFFITLKPTPWLNAKHTIFGRVINGMNVVEKIGKVPTSKPGDKPIDDVVMEKITVEKRK